MRVALNVPKIRTFMPSTNKILKNTRDTKIHKILKNTRDTKIHKTTEEIRKNAKTLGYLGCNILYYSNWAG
jgi:hypothetical protein